MRFISFLTGIVIGSVVWIAVRDVPLAKILILFCLSLMAVLLVAVVIARRNIPGGNNELGLPDKSIESIDNISNMRRQIIASIEYIALFALGVMLVLMLIVSQIH